MFMLRCTKVLNSVVDSLFVAAQQMEGMVTDEVENRIKRYRQPKAAAPVEAAAIPVPDAAPELPAADIAEVVEAAPAQAAEVIEAVSSPALESDFAPAEHLTSAIIQEGFESMATVETTQYASADKAQATLGEMGARMKTAFEKSSKMGEEIVDFAKGNVEALVASAKVAAKQGEELGQEAAEYSKKSFESAMVMFRSLAAVKSPTELLQIQSDFAKSSFDSAVAEASKVSEKMLKIAGDVAQPISTRYSVAAEKIKIAAI